MSGERRKIIRKRKPGAKAAAPVSNNVIAKKQQSEARRTSASAIGKRRGNGKTVSLPKRRRGEIYPLDAPGMPPPGPDILAYAEALGGDHEASGKGKDFRLDNPGKTLPSLFRKLLYSFGDTAIPITHKGKRHHLSVISGHVWGDPYGSCQGPRQADVMVIGKMPGEEENAQGRNMIGKSGNLFLTSCKNLGLKGMGRWYVTNLMKTMHPEADTGGSRLTVGMIKEWLPFLHQEIRLVQPRYILCLGADASAALLEYENGVKRKDKFRASISNMQGRIVEWKYPISRSPDGPRQTKTALVMAITHPAAVLHAPEQEEVYLNGVARFGQMIRGMRWDKEEEGLDHRTITSVEELRDLYYEIKADCQDNLIAIDAEWHGEHPQNKGSYLRTIQISWKHKAGVCIRLRAQGGKWAFEGGNRKTVAKWVNRICKGRRLAGHFFSTDLEWLIHFGIDLRKEFSVPDSWQNYMRRWRRNKGCGFDTGLAAHSISETDDFSLTMLTLRHTTAPRYDVDLLQWRNDYCNKNKLKKEEMEGYGECPDDVLIPYAIYDADVTRRLAVRFEKRLFRDYHGNNCWEPFWISMRAQPGALEMNMTGVQIDRERLDRLTETYMSAKAKLEAQVREWARWPKMNLNSVFHVREFLYGERFSGYERKDSEPYVRKRPPNGRSLRLRPLFTTDDRPMMWNEVVQKGLEDQKTPSTDKMAMAILAQESQEVKRWHPGKNEQVTYDFSKQITWIRDYRFISQVLKSMLRAPKTEKLPDKSEVFLKKDGFYVYPGGLPAAVCDDNRVRTHFYQTKETGRWSSARPPLQNLTKKREVDYRRILGKDYKWPLRTIITAKPGHLLLEADITGAELAGMAIMSGDKSMIEHARRNILPESHPDYYDIHSHVAVMAFNLPCKPTKGGLKSIGKKHMRIVAKSVIFGIAYGRGAKAIALAAKEEKVHITVAEAQQVIDTIFRMYPRLVPFFEECRRRSKKPRWLCGCFGRFRRFPIAREWSVEGDFERQAMNFPIQGMISDLMSRAVDHLYHYREDHDVQYDLVAQIHDAVLLEVPYAYVPKVIDEVIPECMVNRVPIYPCTLDGMPTGAGPYHLGADIDPYERWGADMMPDDCLRLDLDPKYAHWTKTPEGYTHPEIEDKVWVGDVNGGSLVDIAV